MCDIRRPRRASSAPGFTLIELIIAVAILAILAGAVAPVASLVLRTKARAATRHQLEDLGLASAEYFRDVGDLPRSLGDLISDPGKAGWSGPYVLAEATDPRSGRSETVVDAWSRPYRITRISSSVLEIKSAGEDGVFGTGADLERRIDVTPIRRQKTLEQLRTINQAVTLYNGQYLSTDPLPTRYDVLLDRLVSKGFLPDSTPFAVDGWGDGFVPVPAGRTPVVQIGSKHIESAAGRGGGSDSAKKKGEKKGEEKKGKKG